MTLRITVLGCGSSTGVPAIGNYWGACDPNEPKNNRSRSSIAIQSTETTLIIDTGPDFRTQMNKANIATLDAVLYTHAHNDHVHGIDDLRVITYRNKKLIPIYADKKIMEELKKKFKILFNSNDLYPAILESMTFKNQHYGHEISIGDINVIPFEQDHGSCTSTGYRFGNFAYSVDMWKLDQKAIEILKGIKTWIVDCAAYKNEKNPVHAYLGRIYELNEQIGASQVYLTSLSLQMDYQTLLNELPEGYAPAYDGLIVTV